MNRHRKAYFTDVKLFTMQQKECFNMVRLVIHPGECIAERVAGTFSA